MRFKILSSSSAVALTLVCASGAAAQEVTVLSWGGAYETSQVEAYHKPFTAETGIRVVSVSADNPATPIKAQVEAGNVTVDVADVEFSDAVRLCDEGLLEVFDHSILPDGADGTPAVEDFIEGGLTDCAVASIVWSTVYAYDDSRFPDEKPTTIADFFDTEKFPGRRGMRRAPKATLELALMADGVPAEEVYEVLSTPEGVDQAFAKLSTIKGDIIWWEAGSQAPQLLADGEVVMTVGYNGRLFDAAVAENKPFVQVWDGQIMDLDLFVVPRGAPNVDEAMQFIAFATSTQPLADQASYISYGPARASSAPLVGLYVDGETEMGPYMPTAPENMTNALLNDFEFWADRDTELSERFNSWVATN